MDQYLHEVIKTTCLKLFYDGHYPQSALEAMKQVEIELKKKAKIESNLSGVRLINFLWGEGKNIRLRAPFSDKMHKEVKELFIGAFSYYRNYTAHNTEGINEKICFRVLVLASELLDLIDNSEISFENIGGIEGLVSHNIFQSKQQVIELLQFLATQTFPHETYDGMFEQLEQRGFTDWQYQAMYDLSLVEYKSKHVNHAMSGDPEDWDEFGWLELTLKGKELLKIYQP